MRMLTPNWSTRGLTADLFDEMDRFFDDFVENARSSRQSSAELSFAPACDIAETEDHYLMSFDIPGIRQEDVKVEAHDGVLTISGERKREETSDKKERVQRYEKSYGAFTRSFTLPTAVDADKIQARYENGVLELYLPKTEVAKPRQIEIQSGKSGFFSQLLGRKNEKEAKETAKSGDTVKAS